MSSIEDSRPLDTSTLEYKATISGDAQLAFVLQRLEEDEVQNMEEKEQMITRDGNFTTMMQQQEEDTAQRLMEKEQRAVTSTPTMRDLLIVHRVLSLHNFLQSYITQNLGVASKVTTLSMDLCQSA